MCRMARRKTTVYLDEDLLRGAKVLAARTDRKDYEVLEEALREYLGVAVLDRVWARSNLDDDEALDVAYEELDAMRREPSTRNG